MPSASSPTFLLVTNSNAPLLREAAAAAAGHQHFPPAALYLVATPIGNLADISLRAIHVLALVDAVACEDTRHSAVLLQQLGIEKPLLAVHQHNEATAAQLVLQRLAAGERIAYISDAGTPAISDPGALLVAAAQAAGYATLPIPGASSVVAALSVAGDAHAGGFQFVGFLSTRASERQSELQRIADATATQVLFEAPHRIESLAGLLANQFPAAASAVPRTDQAVRICRQRWRRPICRPGWRRTATGCAANLSLLCTVPRNRPTRRIWPANAC